MTEATLYLKYTAAVAKFYGVPRLDFAGAREIIDAYSAWVRVFCPESAEGLIRDLRAGMVRRELFDTS
jgi:hypothetical protein